MNMNNRQLCEFNLPVTILQLRVYVHWLALAGVPLLQDRNCLDSIASYTYTETALRVLARGDHEVGLCMDHVICDLRSFAHA